MIKQLAEAYLIYQRVLLPVLPEQAERHTEHNEILQAILEGDAEKAVSILAEHLTHTRDVMLEVMNQSPTFKSRTRLTH